MASSIDDAAVQTRERDLVRAAKGGDLGAFEALVKRHERRIYGLARRITGSEHEAQDATQQAFLSAVKNLSTFRETAAFSTWLTAIAANASLKILRKRRGLPTISLDETTEPDEDGHIPHPEYIADWRETPDRLAQRAETHHLLDAAIAELNPAHRAVFLLRDVEDLSVRDTAKALGISEANVKVRLLRARMQLRERLTRAFGDEKRRYRPERHTLTHDTPPQADAPVAHRHLKPPRKETAHD
jgi:RNA polymerase sigma-70 factor (ECF subfamily)